MTTAVFAVLHELSVSLWENPDMVVPYLTFTTQSNETRELMEEVSFINFTLDGALTCYVPQNDELMVVAVNHISDLQLLPAEQPKTV